MPGHAEHATDGLPRELAPAGVLLLVAEHGSYGYSLLDELHEMGFRHVDSSSVYRMLRAMEEAGVVRSSWEPPESGPARRTYELTPSGEKCLDDWAAALRDSRDLLGRYLKRCDALE